MKIPNEQVQELTNTLINSREGGRALTQPEIQQAMYLAYMMGRTDGSIQTCNTIVQAWKEPK